MKLSIDAKAIYLIAGRFIQIITSLISLRILSEKLSLEEAGIVFYINSIVSFYSLVIVNPVGMYINRKFNQYLKNKVIIDRIIRFIVFLVLLSITTILFTMITSTLLPNKFSNFSVALALLISMLVFSTNINQTIVPFFNMCFERNLFITFTTLTIVFNLIFSYIFVVYVEASGFNWLFGQVLSNFVIATIAYCKFKNLNNEKLDIGFKGRMIDFSGLKEISEFSLPLTLTTFFMWLQNQSYKILLEPSMGLEYLALLGVGFGISSTFCGIIESVVHQILYPVFYRSISTDCQEKRIRSWNELALYTMPVYVSVVIYLCSISGIVLMIFVDKKYGDSLIFVIIGAFIELTRMLSNIVSSVAHSECSTKSLIRSYFFGGILTVFSVYFVPKVTDIYIVLPLFLLFSILISYCLIVKDMHEIANISFPMKSMINSLFISLPMLFIFVYYIYANSSVISYLSFIILSVYFILINLKYIKIYHSYITEKIS